MDTKELAQITLQRLVNGDDGNLVPYLETFFSGKNDAATQEGLLALITILARATHKPAFLGPIWTIACKLAAERQMDRVIDAGIAEIVRARLVPDPNKADFHNLSACLALDARRFIPLVEGQVRDYVHRATLAPDAWVRAIYDLGELKLFPRPAQTDNDGDGNPALVSLYRTHCALARDLYSQPGEDAGIAAALCTIAQDQHPRAWYERARAEGRPVSLAFATSDKLLTNRRPLPAELYTELFGEDWRNDPRTWYVKSWFQPIYHLAGDGAITLKNDEYMQRVAERYFALGLWRDGLDALRTGSHQKSHRIRSVNCVLLPAMATAEGSGRIAVAAALGQILLAEHRRHTEADKRTLASGDRVRSPLLSAALVLARQEFGAQQTIPAELVAEKTPLNHAVMARCAQLTSEFIARIEKLFDQVIEQNLVLDLQTYWK